MCSVRPRLPVLAAAISLSLWTAPLYAAEPKLRLVQPVGNSAKIVSQPLELRSLRFEPGADPKRVVAQTRAGNVHCGSSQTVAAGSGAMALVLDGRTYRLQTQSLPTGLAAPVEYELGSGEVELIADGLNPLTQCGSDQFFGAADAQGAPLADPNLQYDLQFEGGQPLTIAEAVYFNLSDRTLEVRVADPVLCTSYGSGGVTLALADPNNPEFATAPLLLAGLERVEFLPNSLSLRPYSARPAGSLAPLVQCSTPGDSRTVQTASGNLVFATGFEDNEGGPRVSLDILLSETPLTEVSRDAGESVQFTLRVRNNGNRPAANLRIREYAPLQPAYAAGLAQVQLEQSATDSCVVTAGSNSACTGAAGTGLGYPLSFNLPSLAVGEVIDFTLNRRVAQGVSGAGDLFGFAAFVDPAQTPSSGPDLQLNDNAAWARFAVS